MKKTKRFMKSKDVENLKPRNAQWSICHYLSAVMEQAKTKLHDELESINVDCNVIGPVSTNGANGVVAPVNNDDQPILRQKLNIEASVEIPKSSNAKIPDKRTSKKRKTEDYNYIPVYNNAVNKGTKKLGQRSINNKCKKAVVTSGPSPPTQMPEEYKKSILSFLQGSNFSGEFKLVIQKGLYSSDLDPGQNRLLIPSNQVVTADFLNEEEKRSIGSRDEKNNNKLKFMEVRVIDPGMELRTLNLNKWATKSSFNYLLNGKWMEIVKKCKLETGMVLQVWSFRVDGVLGLALVRS